MWFSLGDLVGVSGLPSTKQGIHKKARREEWRSRPRMGRGGGREYHIASLPEEARLALLEARISEAQEEEISEVQELQPEIKPVVKEEKVTIPSQDKRFVTPTEVKPHPETLDTETELRIASKDFILRAYDTFEERTRQHGWSKTESHENFAKFYNARLLREYQIYVPDEVYESTPKVSRSSIYRDRSLRNKHGSRALGGGGYGNRRNSGLIDQTPELQEAIKACLAITQCQGKAPQIRNLLKSYFELESIPSEQQIYRWVKRWSKENPFEWLLLRNKSEAKNKGLPAFGNRDNTERPNQLWELDSSPVDLMLKYTDPLTGEIKKKRYNLVAAIDVHTRRAKIHVSETSKGDAILAVLRKAILSWGVPESVKTDNGKDYISIRVSRFLGDLGVNTKLCLPGQPQEKPHIERFFRTFQHDKLELLPGFVGHSLSERAARRSHPDWNESSIDLEMSVEEFQEWTDRWVKDYEAAHHRGIDTSPIQKLTQAAAKGWLQKMVASPRQLDFLLMAGEESRTVGKEGLQLNNRFYIAPELGAYIRQKVHVRFDPQDPRHIYVYDSPQLNKFICQAVWREAPDVGLAEMAERAKSSQKEIEQVVAVARKEGRKIQKKIAKDPYALFNEGVVEPLQRIEEFTNQAIETVREAANPTPKQIQPTPEEIERQEQVRERLSRKKAEETPQETHAERYSRLWSEAKQRDLTEEEATWMARYEASPQGRRIKRILERDTLAG